MATATPVTSAASPPTSSPARGPAVSAIQPMIGAPIGVEPRKTTEYSAMTRPRIAGSDASCSDELTPAAKVTLAAPSGTSVATCSAKAGAPAAASVSAPNAIDEPANSHTLTRPRAPAASAPSTEPTPRALVSAA